MLTRRNLITLSIGVFSVLLIVFSSAMLWNETEHQKALVEELRAEREAAETNLAAFQKDYVQLQQENHNLTNLLVGARNAVEMLTGRTEFMAVRIERIAAMANAANGAPTDDTSPWQAFKRFMDIRDDANYLQLYELYEERLRTCLSFEEFQDTFVFWSRARGTVFLGQSVFPDGLHASIIYDDGTQYGGGPREFILKQEHGRWVIPLPQELEKRCSQTYVPQTRVRLDSLRGAVA